MSQHQVSSWRGVVRVLRQYAPRAVVRIEKGVLSHPRGAGMSPSIGLPEGQVADFRLALANGGGLHVKDFGTHYEAHLDEVHPDIDLVEHLRRDAPGVLVASGVALGAVIGRSVGASKDGTLVGAALGGLFAALLASTGDD